MKENTYVNEFSGENEFKFLGTGLWIEYGLNIVNNCKFMIGMFTVSIQL